jgi:heat shock protein HtpX
MTERISFHDQISRNKLKSTFLLIIIFLVFIVFGVIIGLAMGPDYFALIMIIATLISITYIWVGYYNSHKIAIKSVNAKLASPNEYSEYHNLVEGLCLASGMPKPELYIMQNDSINAFASGRNPENAVICVTTGTLYKLDKQELEGVLAHELSHIANYDIRFMTLTAVLVGMIAIISQIFLRSLFWSSLSGGRDRDKSQIVFIIVGIVLAILAPIAVTLVQLGISRKREYSADASAVKFIRSPTGLINALKKIKNEHPSPREVQEQKKNINKAVAPLFLSDPFKSKVQGFFQTHPPIDRRILTLERM